MAEKRSLIQRVFGFLKKDKGRNLTQLELMSGYIPVFTSWGNEPYDADIVRSAVDAIARNAAKLKAKHIRKIEGDIIHVNDNLERILTMRPNAHMNAFDFFYRLVTTLMIENNAFAYPRWDGLELKELWPINCSRAEFLEDNTNTIYVRFYFSNGGEIILPYSDVIHLRRHYYSNDMLGETNEPINNTLSAVHTTNEGLAQAIKTSGSLRGIIKYQGIIKESDLKSNRDRFVEEYMSVQNTGGVAALDAKADYIELKGDPKMVNAAQMKELRDAVFRYFGVSDGIITGDYTEEEWNAFYESRIEPIAIQMSLEFTTKLFTARELGHGNEIVFESNRLQYASVKTKVSMVKEMIPMGLLTINEGREIFNLAPVPDGHKRLVSLNFVQADKQNLYQVGENDEENDET